MKHFTPIVTAIALIVGGIYLIIPDKTMYHIDIIYAILVWTVTGSIIFQQLKERKEKKKNG